MRFLALPFVLITIGCFSQATADTTLANQNSVLAEASMKDKKFEKAIYHFTIASPGFEKAGAWDRVVTCYRRTAESYLRLLKYDSAFVWAQRAINVSNVKLDKKNLQRGHALAIIGRVNKDMGNYDQSLVFCEEALSVFKAFFAEHHPEIARSYADIGLAYMYKGDFATSIRHNKMALEIFKKAFGENHREVALTYFRLGLDYAFTSDFSSAVENYEKSIATYRIALGEKAPELANPYKRIGEIYGVKNDWPTALSYYRKAEKFLTDENLLERALLHRDIATAQASLANYEDAKINLQKSIVLGEKIVGKKHPAMASIYYALGDTYEHQGDFDRAVEYLHKSLIANFISFDNQNVDILPTSRDYRDRNELYRTLKNRAQVYVKKYSKDQKIANLLASLKTYQLFDTLINEARRISVNIDDKIELGKWAVEIFEGAINVCSKLFEATNEKKYSELAFVFSEKNKASVLAGALAEIEAKGIGLIPDQVLAFEKELKKQQAELQSKIQQLKLSDKNATVTYEKELFQVNRRIDSLFRQMELNFPKYYSLKNQEKILTTLEVQRRLKPGSALLEFFEGFKDIYIFTITTQQYVMRSIPRDSVYENLLSKFRKNVDAAQIATRNSHTESGYRNFVSTSQGLFDLLLKEPLKTMEQGTQIKNLIIIPDGILSYLPFDILLVETPKDEALNYLTLHYLLHDYTVAYAYSATLNFKKPTIDAAHKGNNFLAFAPSYQAVKTDSLTIASLGKFRDAITELKWNQHEVKRSSALVGGDYYLAGEATESRFKSQAEDCAIIHLATHALIDDENPFNSRFVFAQNSNVADDGYLYAFELYSMRLNAQMVVLSACNTGYGKLAKGEGIMSLGRAFSYAGVPSVIISHWKVDDEATSILMEYFYENLSKGMNKSEAMREAKLTYIKNADPAKSHPFFWGAFVTLGEDGPIQFNPGNNWLGISLITAGIILMTFLSVAWYRNRRRKVA